MTQRLFVDEIFEIVRVNMSANGNRAETVRRTGYSRPTVDRYCNAADILPGKSGVRPDGRFGRAITAKEEQRILNLYEPLEGNAERIAEAVERNARTVRIYLKKNSIKPKGTGGRFGPRDNASENPG